MCSCPPSLSSFPLLLRPITALPVPLLTITPQPARRSDHSSGTTSLTRTTPPVQPDAAMARTSNSGGGASPATGHDDDAIHPRIVPASASSARTSPRMRRSCLMARRCPTVAIAHEGSSHVRSLPSAWRVRTTVCEPPASRAYAAVASVAMGTPYDHECAGSRTRFQRQPGRADASFRRQPSAQREPKRLQLCPAKPGRPIAKAVITTPRTMLPGNAVHDMPSSRAIAFQRPRTTAIPTPVPRSLLTRQIVRGYTLSPCTTLFRAALWRYCHG